MSSLHLLIVLRKHVTLATLLPVYYTHQCSEVVIPEEVSHENDYGTNAEATAHAFKLQNRPLNPKCLEDTPTILVSMELELHLVAVVPMCYSSLPEYG